MRFFKLRYLKLCYKAGVSPFKGVIERPSSELAKKTMRNILNFHKEIGTTKGFKYKMGLPIRGQRNKTNAKTAYKLSYR